MVYVCLVPDSKGKKEISQFDSLLPLAQRGEEYFLLSHKVQ